MTKNGALLTQFSKAVLAFKEILDLAKDAKGKNKIIYRDSAIKRFEFCVDLAWKSMKDVLEQKYGVKSSAPKPIVKEAFLHGLISSDAEWLEIIDMRNLTSHTYDEDGVNKIFSGLPAVRGRFEELLKALEGK